MGMARGEHMTGCMKNEATHIKIGDTVSVRGFHGVACVYRGPQTEPGALFVRCWECDGSGIGGEDEGADSLCCDVCGGSGDVYDEEPEPVETGRALVVMVGDDHVYAVDPDDMTPIAEEDYCHACGQIGCGHS